MSDTTCTERLTRDNTALLLTDHQVGLYSDIVDIPLAELKHNVVALTNAARVLGLPIVATTTATDSMGPSGPRRDPRSGSCTIRRTPASRSL